MMIRAEQLLVLQTSADMRFLAQVCKHLSTLNLPSDPRQVRVDIARSRQFGLPESESIMIYVECMTRLRRCQFDTERVEKVLRDGELDKDMKLIVLRATAAKAESLAKGDEREKGQLDGRDIPWDPRTIK